MPLKIRSIYFKVVMRKMKKLTGWGRFPSITANEVFPNSELELLEVLNKNESYIARGNGRSYGDSSINKDLTVTMLKLNKLIDWDSESGELVAEAGLMIADIIDIFLPRGWFPHVIAGTKFITLGGAIACDVHGKNHHRVGSFGNFVNWIDIINEKNQIVRCSRTENPELFHWTIGGMGLTGVILRCSIQLKKLETGWIKQRVVVNHTFSETLESFSENNDSTYSVAWLDCLSSGKAFGRSILILGEHATKSDMKGRELLFPERQHRNISLCSDMPSALLNNFTVSLFNNLYFNLNKFQSKPLIDWDKYFFPLDSIGNWNRLYGSKGFFQFQCILPKESSLEGYKKILKLIQKGSSGSFLGVIKKFGLGNNSLSFPMEGFTLALDFKATSRNLKVAEELTKIVNHFGGKIYLAKDSFMDRKLFFPQVNKDLRKEFLIFRNKSVKSQQSIRINL